MRASCECTVSETSNVHLTLQPSVAVTKIHCVNNVKEYEISCSWLFKHNELFSVFYSICKSEIQIRKRYQIAHVFLLLLANLNC